MTFPDRHDTMHNISLIKSLIYFSETYRALATSFHTNLKNCPALQFHPEFLEVNIGGSEMIDSLLTSANISKFCGKEFDIFACAFVDPCFSKYNTIIEPRRDKTNKVAVRPAKTLISLHIRPVWS